LFEQFEYRIAGFLNDVFPVLHGQVFKIFPDQIGSNVGRHDDERILEIDYPAFVVGESSIVKYLQQHVEYVWVSFLNFIKQDD